jgi:AcrR family transcriptional regulator
MAMIDPPAAFNPAGGQAENPAPETAVSPQKLAILDVAQVLFTQQGYEGLSIRNLAEHCGLAKATIYHHFRDKEDLFFSVLERDFLCLRAQVAEAAAAETEPLARLRAATRAYARLLREQRTGIIWSIHENGQLKAKLQTFFEQRADIVLRPWMAILQEGVATGALRPLNARLCALSLLAMINVLIFYERRVAGAPLEVDPVEHALDLFVNGVIQPDKPTNSF